MATEHEYRRLLQAEAKTLDRAVRELLKEFRGALPFLKKAKLKTGYFSSESNGSPDDYYGWWLERDKDFVIRRVRVGVRASRMSCLFDDNFHPHFVVAAGYEKKPNWGDLSTDQHEQQLILDDTNVANLRPALRQVIAEGI